ncbi:MAG: hypothetical protein J7527_17195, partial [Chitinophagaceae bacterium]|nr:hypothetical protein [Chitinophagaceae bacterium]
TVVLSALMSIASVFADLQGDFTGAFDNKLQWTFLKRDTGLKYYDNIHLVGYTKDKKMAARDLYGEHPCPHQIIQVCAPPRTNPKFCEIGGIQFINQEYLLTNNRLLDSQNDRHYLGMFIGNGCKLIVERFDNGVFEGTLSGFIWTGSNRAARITHGKFRMSLTQLRKGMDLR